MAMIDLEQLKSVYTRTQSLHATARELGHSVTHVHRLLQCNFPEIIRDPDTYKGHAKPSKEELRRLYQDEHKTLREIADVYGSDPSRVRKWMVSAGIQTRNRRESATRKYNGEDPSRSTLVNLYLKKRMSITKIAEATNTSRWVVSECLKRYDIPIRPPLFIQMAAGDTDAFWAHADHGKRKMKNGKMMQYQSSYERVFLELCDELELHVSRWSKRDWIPYQIDGKEKRYYPDFIVHSLWGIVVVEVKPGNTLPTAANKAKTCAAYEWTKQNDVRYRIVTEYQLGIPDPHARQSRTKLHEWVEEVERAGDEPFLDFLLEIKVSYNSPTKPRLSEWLFGDEDVR